MFSEFTSHFRALNEIPNVLGSPCKAPKKDLVVSRWAGKLFLSLPATITCPLGRLQACGGRTQPSCCWNVFNEIQGALREAWLWGGFSGGGGSSQG